MDANKKTAVEAEVEENTITEDELIAALAATFFLQFCQQRKQTKGKSEVNQQSNKPRSNGTFEQEIHLEGGGVVALTIAYRETTPIQAFRLTSAIKTMNNTLMARMDLSSIMKCRYCHNSDLLPEDRYCGKCGELLHIVRR